MEDHDVINIKATLGHHRVDQCVVLSAMGTEADLRDWRSGQILAERLCTGILQISGYVDVDPQATLGGPDNKKDILARRNDRRFVAAVYFPPTPPPFRKIRAKFYKRPQRCPSK